MVRWGLVLMLLGGCRIYTDKVDTDAIPVIEQPDPADDGDDRDDREDPEDDEETDATDVAPTDTGSAPRWDRCCQDLGSCIPAQFIPADSQDALSVDTCPVGGADLLCVPDMFVNQTQPSSCVSFSGWEGRCLPECLAGVGGSPFPVDSCATGELCIPCYDPLSGVPTDACTANGDTPDDPPPPPPERCCGNQGTCVDPALTGSADLGADTCSDTTQVCVPDVFVDDTVQPPTCTSLAGSEGRCLSECLPAIYDLIGVLPRDVCDLGELCAPCHDPITGQATGTCSTPGDAPTQPPVTYDDCCLTDGTHRGKCLPDTLVDDPSSLSADTCTQADDVCVPTNLAQDPPVPFAACQTGGWGVVVSTDGACVPDCLVADEWVTAVFGQQGCGTGESCIACWTLAGDTGVCLP